VAHPEEGATLRLEGLAVPILVMGAYIPAEAELLLRYGLTPMIGDGAALQDLEVRARRARGRVGLHLHVDTGMGRLGVRPAKAAFLASTIARSPDVALAGVSTHLACADEEDLAFTRQQVLRFRGVLDALARERIAPGLVHAANSAAVLRFGSQLAFDAVRPGAALYGILPTPACARPANAEVRTPELAPALSWRTTLARIERVPAGTPVSYGGTQVTDRETRIGTLSVGYEDGFDRHLQGKGAVLIRGRRHPVFGRVTMDHTMVDLGPAGPERPGDVVTLVGADGTDRIGIEEFAAWSDRIPYEVGTALGARVHRVVHGERTPALRTIAGGKR